MALNDYVLRHADTTVTPIPLAQGSIDRTSTSIALTGRATKYGEILQTNLVNLLENFASPNAPLNPITGQIWFDKSVNTAKVFGTGGNWKSISPVSYVSLTALPTSTTPGDLIYVQTQPAGSVAAGLYTYSGTTWTRLADSSSVFSPATAGTAGQLLVSTGTRIPTWVSPSSLTVGTATQTVGSITLSSTGNGTAPGATYNGSQSITLSYNSIGAAAANGSNATGTWNISVASTSSLSGGAPGSLPYQSGASATTFLPIGTSGQVLTSTGTGPQWSTFTGFSTTDDNSTAATYYPAFVTSAGGSAAKTASAKLTFNPSTGLLTSSALTTAVLVANASATIGGGGLTTITSGTTGSINNMSIGLTTPAAGSFTSVNSTGKVEVTGRGLNYPQFAMRDQSFGRVGFYDNTDPDSGIYNYTMSMDAGNFYFNMSTVNTAYDYGTTKVTFDLNGNITAVGDISAFSDARVKTNVATISNALSMVESMRGVTFTRIDSGAEGVGVIAQEMEEVLPQVVKNIVTDGVSTKTVSYGNIVGVLIEAIKELSAKVDYLQQQLNTEGK